MAVAVAAAAAEAKAEAVAEAKAEEAGKAWVAKTEVTHPYLSVRWNRPSSLTYA